MLIFWLVVVLDAIGNQVLQNLGQVRFFSASISRACIALDPERKWFLVPMTHKDHLQGF
jgi:hypothetical protein